ncbi:hypothetical protein AMAG_14546 [Allomyces macrogynus ATCC 38327]|uniref:YCII-related domain-containing protein n=1 Tax=Allomyces macrogynus (strain ATCC 38327) TaxID=578462 RepID=A0A0L0T6P2_ALLM3|nr:hypothetical protein AMAG_14546 [Allomyces macrogynus ATCC 38327]|eukprot:KNE70412.1 hypothetical protein AMAG_14546 [Allomyces macrogynus ATCC 38327]
MFSLCTPVIRAAASVRAAATAPAASRGLHFLVTLNDFTDKDALARRMATRPRTFDSGTMIGSYMMYKADSLDHVHELLKDDPYVQGRVWDYENATITPVRIARLGDTVLEATPKKE